MNFLFPIFLAGITAISLPIILHMIRRNTRKRVMFSSLMFLRTTMPRFRNRSRPENLLLLILRCIIICLLVLAFMRPFFNKPIETLPVNQGKRTVLLIDTSASMRRAGIWDRVVNQAQSVLEDIQPTDRASVITFDQNTNTIIGFESWNELDVDQRIPIVTKEISDLSPTWSSTNLGNALVTAAEAIEDDEVSTQQPIGQNQIVLISDLQQGSNIDALHNYEWPGGIELVVKSIPAKGTTNAAMQVVTNRNYLTRSDSNAKPRIRIMNSADAMVEQFQLSWTSDNPTIASEKPLDVYVPPGYSVVTEIPAEPNVITGHKLLLSGDNQDFDNTLYLAPNLENQVDILYIGNDQPEDSGQMLYYLQRAFLPTTALEPQLVAKQADNLSERDISSAQLIIITDAIQQGQIQQLRRQLESGSTVLLAIKSPDAASTLASLIDLSNVDCREAQVDKYAMISSIEFEHPLMTSFSDPRFGDFTKIHFWKYRSIDIENIPNSRILAAFDNGDPAWFEVPVGKGSLLVLTSSWQPSDSQFALSSKFVPFLYSILEYNGILSGQQSQYVVGDHVRIPKAGTSESGDIQIRKPDNSIIKLESGQEVFEQTDMPGIYTIESERGNQLFAINLPAEECRTAPMPLEEIEQLGVSFEDTSQSAEDKILQAKQNSFIKLENEQKLWRWLIIALLVVLILETWLAGWLTRPAVSDQGESK